MDLAAFARQRAEIAQDSVLRLGEWLSPNPYATNRMESVRLFHHTALYEYWEERIFSQPAAKAVPVEHRADQVKKQDCASFGRRLAAIAIDLSLVTAFGNIVVTTVGAHSSGVHVQMMGLENNLPWLEFLAYNILLVAIAGQTFGMMIVSVRVTTLHFGAPGCCRSSGVI